MSNSSSSVAPAAALTVVATAAPPLTSDLADLDPLLAPASYRINYVVRNPGPAQSAAFDVVVFVGERPIDRHSYLAGLDAGRALASYFRVPVGLLDHGRATLTVRLEGPSGKAACRVRLRQ